MRKLVEEVKKTLLFLLLFLTISLCIAFAVGDVNLSTLLYSYSTEAVGKANTTQPEDIGLSLTEREAEIFRLGVAHGYDLATGEISSSASALTGNKSTSSGTSGETMVWIPTRGGKKYHKKSSCSGMIDPQYVTISDAKKKGFDACGRCNPPRN